MNEFNNSAQLKSYLKERKEAGAKIGFVPTMGALHDGHVSLIKKAQKENDVVVASIFINPKQFNNLKDLKNYPVKTEYDLRLLSASGCDCVYLPSYSDIYPTEEDKSFDFEHLDTIMEGKFRPGHFNGVAKVVMRFFEIIKPDNAYFGEKDYQQLAVIKLITEKAGLNVNIIPCPTVRDENGLAYSSRNQLLKGNEMEAARLIPSTLFKIKKLNKSMSIPNIKNWVKTTFESSEMLNLEYFEIVDSETLQSFDVWDSEKKAVACIAVKCNKIRLIDNISL